MPGRKSEGGDLIKKEQCALEVYKWLVSFRNALLMLLVCSILIFSCSYVGIFDIAFTTMIIVIAIFMVYARKVFSYLKYIETKYHDVVKMHIVKGLKERKET